MSLHIHFDPVGGVAGDMVAGALLDAFPELEAPVQADLQAALGGMVKLVPRRGVSNGHPCLRVEMLVQGASRQPTGRWADIRDMLAGAPLPGPVRDGAVAIGGILAAAEAACHGVPVEEVHFHEIADWDSLADVVAAASLAHRSGALTWTVGSLPMGAGIVAAAHGSLPLPAPATALLLQGFQVHADGEWGERVTPTGAAILRHFVNVAGARPAGRLRVVGVGAGTRALVDRPNLLRAFVLEVAPDTDHVVRVAFDVDDMTPEELGVALDRLRSRSDVLDAGFSLGVGKKGRPRFAVEVLAGSGSSEAVAEACFVETSTLGLRLDLVERRLLRRAALAGVHGVKRADRPGGSTAKVESNDLVGIPGLAARRRAARIAEDRDE